MITRSFVRLAILFVFLGSTLLTARVAQAGHNQASYDPNATIDMSTNADPIFNTWHPNAFAESDIINKLIFSGVTKWKLNGAPQGDLATGWKISKNGLIWTFDLHQGVKWQDGKPFTSADVAYTYNNIVLDKAHPTSKASVYSAVQTVRTHGPYQVQFVLNSPWSALPSFLAYYAPVLPKHIFQGQDPFNLTSFNKQHPIGTGPYRMTKYVPGESITLTANPTYFGPKPKIKRIVFHIIPQPTTEVSSLLSGSLSYINETDVQLLAPLEGNSNFIIQKNADQTYYYALLNTAVAPFDDVRVRQALEYAIDKKGMIQALLKGEGLVATGPIAPLQKAFYDPHVQQYPYDPTKAVQLLQQAGYQKGSDGTLTKDGKPFTIDFTAGQIRFLVPASELIQADWQKIGIKVNLKVLDWNTYIQQVVVQRSYQASFAWWSTPPDPDAAAYYACSAAKAGFNISAYCNPKLDSIMNAGRKATKTSDRKKAYDQMQVFMAQQLPLLYLFYPYSFNVMQKNLHSPSTGYAFAIDHISDWYVAK
jgi:peptide/nickel transport system substrate-binding protein